MRIENYDSVGENRMEIFKCGLVVLWCAGFVMGEVYL